MRRSEPLAPAGFVARTAGPCLSTHTACSSSLVATHLAHNGLLGHEAAAAASCGIFMVLLPGTMSGISQLQVGGRQAAASDLTAATQALLTPGGCRQLCAALPQALSPVGRCKTFEASGDGYGRGEGCAVALMQRSGGAGGDAPAVALVHSTVVNQDGRSSSLTAPNGPSQTALVATALQNLGARAALPSGLHVPAPCGASKEPQTPVPPAAQVLAPGRSAWWRCTARAPPWEIPSR